MSKNHPFADQVEAYRQEKFAEIRQKLFSTSIAEQIAKAQNEVSLWALEKIESMQLEGSSSFYPKKYDLNTAANTINAVYERQTSRDKNHLQST